MSPFEEFQRRMVRFDAFSHWLKRTGRVASYESAQYLFNGFGCVSWDGDVFLRMMLCR